jgi:hypothetical protein
MKKTNDRLIPLIAAGYRIQKPKVGEARVDLVPGKEQTGDGWG